MSNIRYLDSLRGIACFIVVLSHLSLVYYPYLHNFNNGAIPETNSMQFYIHNSSFSIIYSGTFAVYLFFILSGFVLTHSMLNKDIEKYMEAYVSRYFRLMIPALISCVFAYLIYGNINYIYDGKLSEWFNEIIVNKPNIIDAIYAGAIEPFVYGKSQYNIILWTMKTELIGSFFIYLCCYMYKTETKYFHIIIGAVFISLFFLDQLIMLGIICFFFGFICNIKYNQINFKFPLLCLLLGLYLGGVHVGSQSYSIINDILKSKSYVICNMASAILVFLFVIRSRNTKKILGNSFLVKIGQLSFPIYLIHMPVMIFMTAKLFPVIYNGFNYNESVAISALAIIVVTFILSIPFYKIDKFSVKVSKNIAKNILSKCNKTAIENN